MYVLGHLGIGLGLAWLVSSRLPRFLDYRLILVGAMLPDLIDKPLGAALSLESRLWAHTIVFLVAILALSAVPSWQGLRWLGFGVGTHLLLDRIWEQPDVILWPAYGWAFPGGVPSLEHFWDVLLHDPYVQLGETLGHAVLLAFAWTQGIRSWNTLRAFLREGTPRAAAADPPRTSDH